MAIFQPRLQTQVQAREPVRDQTTGSALSAISDLAGGFFKTQAKAAPAGPSYAQAKYEAFGQTMSILEQGLESGTINQKQYEGRLSAARVEVGRVGNVPETLQTQYEFLSGRRFESADYGSDEDYDQQVLLEGELAKTLRPSIVRTLESQGVAATKEAVDQAVLLRVEEIALLGANKNMQDLRRAQGLSVQPTPLLENLRSDYSILAEAVKASLGDGIVEQSEYTSMVMSVNNLVATKYAGYETNPEINGVIEQMKGLLADIGKNVSEGQAGRTADNIQLILQGERYDALTIGVARGMFETNPELFYETFVAGKVDEGNKTVADAIGTLLNAGPGNNQEIIDIFDKSKAPKVAEVAGTNPSKLDIPTVQDNPEAYQTVVDKFSISASTTDINNLRNNPEARNAWLTSMNVVGSAVSSQGDEYILGEKLLSVFASNGVVKNLDAIYQFDPQNAAQTNDVLQGGLAAERLRQVNELNNRLDSGAGEGKLVLVDPTGKLQLNDTLIAQNAASLPGGEAGWKLMSAKIAAAGGLEAFVKLPKTTTRGANPDVSINVKGQTYFLKDMFRIDFAKMSKLSGNIQMIDTKLDNLETLAERYQSDTDLLRGKTLNQELATEAVDVETNAITKTKLGKQGTPQSPFSLGPEGATDAETDAAFDALPVNSYFINPANGRLLQKKG